MVKRCKNCTQVLAPDSLYFYCCDDYMRVCRDCSKTYRCIKCNKLCSLSRTLVECRDCDQEVKLYRCKCGACCESCLVAKQDYYSKKCKFCTDHLVPISASFAHSASQIVINTSSLKETSQCVYCFAWSDPNDMYCNACGHFFCRTCLSKYNKDTRCPHCKMEVIKEGINDFLNVQNCMVCEKFAVPGQSWYGPDKNLCEVCYPIVCKDVLPPVATDPILNAGLKEEKFQESKSGKKTYKDGLPIANKENVVSANPAVVVANGYTAAAKGPVYLEPVPLGKPQIPVNNFLSPNVPSVMRGDMRTPEKKVGISPAGSPTQGSIQKQNSPSISVSGRDLSKSNASMVDPTVPITCTSCRVPFLSKILLTTNCKSKHKMCRFCTLKFRGKDCYVCKIAEQEHLDKYFCYKYLNSYEKLAYNTKLANDGLCLCFGCNIILQKNRALLEKGRSYCKPCVLRLK